MNLVIEWRQFDRRITAKDNDPGAVFADSVAVPADVTVTYSSITWRFASGMLSD